MQLMGVIANGGSTNQWKHVPKCVTPGRMSAPRDWPTPLSLDYWVARYQKDYRTGPSAGSSAGDCSAFRNATATATDIRS